MRCRRQRNRDLRRADNPAALTVSRCRATPWNGPALSGAELLLRVGSVAGAQTGSPAVLTLAMFPILVWMYVRLARREEREVWAEFGEAYARYAAAPPAFFPRLRWAMRGRDR